MIISYKICHEIARELTFNEDEFSHRCLIILAGELCPQRVGEVEAIRLSRRTVVTRLQHLRWAGHVELMGESRNAYRVLVGKPEGKRPLGRPRRRWEDNIKMDLREVGYDDRDWINLAQDRDKWLAYVRAAMNLRFLKSHPEISQPKKKIVAAVDSFDEEVIRLIYNFYTTHKRRPTLQSLLPRMDISV
ncbi:hypothetical protein ANN_07505 [Periplaneta americana]|uniref:Uncharacterized protein n=1 Tax=Periplaneta americana TaxID=6978 RepID=A0ABQ8T052_PERAM|nr:hypothetical protein ANN_07505 [Periplaneta americana]